MVAENLQVNDRRNFILVGGFLGAGKTTLIGRMVRSLAAKGIRSGVITNDQSTGLVDTALMEAAGAQAVAEVSGGCFCCHLEDLIAVLAREEWSPDTKEGGFLDHAPQVIIGEPVGSCTDLMSTVVLPLERVYRMPFRLSPLSVVVDGRRALASLGGRRTPGVFSKDVGYIYRKQIEEAEIVVVNKTDVMAAEDVEDLLARLEKEYPEKEKFVLSARSGEGVKAWMGRVLGATAAPGRLMEVDYDVYGTGEALLGWFNATLKVGDGDSNVLDGDEWLLGVAREISERLAETKFEVAHFKMSLKDDEGRLGTVNQVMGGVPPEISRKFGGAFRQGLLTINLRAEGEPEKLREIVGRGLEDTARRAATPYRFTDEAAFRPGQPVPTARVTAL